MSNIPFTLHTQSSTAINVSLLYAASSKYEGEWSGTPHSHPYAEFFYVLRGEIDFRAEGERYSLHEDDLIVINPDVSHTERPRGPGTVEYVSFGVEGLCMDPAGSGMWSSCSLFHCRQSRSEVRFFLRLLLAEFENHLPDYEQLCCHAFESFLVFLRRAHPQELTVTAPKRTARECSAVKRYIDANFRQPLSLDHLAEVSQLNKYYLAHAFREYIGLSPINYLNSRRVEEARVLLRDTSHSISEIAGIVGFSSQSYFAQVFQKAVGESPGEYRKRLRRGRQEKQE